MIEAHRTPDGRAATPTVVILDERGRFVGAWSERPSELQAWYIAQKPTLPARDLASRKAAWYARDAGRSTLVEIVQILAK